MTCPAYVRLARPILWSAVLLCATLAEAHALFRVGAPRPRWDVIGWALAALACAAVWWGVECVAVRWGRPAKGDVRGATGAGSSARGACAARATPTPGGPGAAARDRGRDGAGSSVPPVPARLSTSGESARDDRFGRPRPFVTTLAMLAAACAVAATAGVAQLPAPRAAALIGTLQRAGARSATGVITSPPTHLHLVDAGLHRSRHGGYTYHTPTWTADLVVTVHDGPRSERITVHGATLRTTSPATGETTGVLYAPARPDLPGYANDNRNLAVFAHNWYPSALSLAATIAALLAGPLLAWWLLRVRRKPPGEEQAPRDAVGRESALERERLARAAAEGRVHAVRVRVEYTDPPRPDDPGTSTVHLAFADGTGRRVALHGFPDVGPLGTRAWLCLPPDSLTDQRKRLPIALVTDTDRIAWGSVRRVRVLPYLSAARDGSGTLRETSPDRRLTLDPRLPRPFPRPALLETRRARALLTGGTLVLLAVLAPLLTPLPNWFTWLCAALGAILAAGTAERVWELPAVLAAEAARERRAPGRRPGRRRGAVG